MTKGKALSIRTFSWPGHAEHHETIENILLNAEYDLKVRSCGISPARTSTCELHYNIEQLFKREISSYEMQSICQQCRTSKSIFKDNKAGVGRDYHSNEIFSTLMKRHRVTSIQEIKEYVGENGRAQDNIQSLLDIYRQADRQISNFLKIHGNMTFAFMFNGRFSIPHAYLIACMNQKLPVICHEYDVYGEGITLALNASFGNVHQLYNSINLESAPSNWEDEIYEYQYKKLKKIKNRNKILTRELSGLGDTLVYFTSSSDEYAADDPSASYESQVEYIEKLAEYANHNRCKLIVRCHPNNGILLHPQAAVSFLERVRKQSREYDYILLEPTSNICSYTLMDMAKCSFVSDSHIALEGLSAGMNIYSLNQVAAICKKIPEMYVNLRSLEEKLNSEISMGLIQKAQIMYYKITVGRSIALSELREMDALHIAKKLEESTRREHGYIMKNNIFSKPKSLNSLNRSVRLMEQLRRLYSFDES